MSIKNECLRQVSGVNYFILMAPPKIKLPQFNTKTKGEITETDKIKGKKTRIFCRFISKELVNGKQGKSD